MSERFLVAILLAGLVGEAHAQEPESVMRPGQKTSFDQSLRLRDGSMVVPRSAPMLVRPALKFAVPGIEPGKILSSAGSKAERAKLVQRANEAHAAVMKCIFKADGSPDGTSEEMLVRLRKASEDATGTLKQDLSNMLVAALAEVKVQPDAAAPVAPFKVWSYRGLREGPDQAALCGPPIEAQPDSTLFIPVLNLLRKEELALPGSEIPRSVPLGGLNDFHGFDVINLHTHGLNVSPEWPADDVFREIHPYQLKFFVYHVPADHVAGTFWYHPHKHGAAMAQVSGGMAGPLILGGTGAQAAGLDALGAARGWKQDWREEFPPLMLQQFAFYRQKAAGLLPEPRPYFFRPDFFSLFHIENLENTPSRNVPPEFLYEPLLCWMRENLESPKPAVALWVNGQLIPELKAIQTGDTTRLRLINAGIEEQWDFQVRPPDGLPADQVKIQVIAWDGIPLPEPYLCDSQNKLILAPGNRADVLIWFGDKAAGTHYITASVESGVKDVVKLRVEGSVTKDPAFLSKEDQDLQAILKTPPPPATEAVTFRGLQTDMGVVPVQGTTPPVYKFDTGKFWLNGLPFPGKPKHFNLFGSTNITLDAFGHPVHWHVNPIYFEAAADRGSRGLPPGPYWADVLLGKKKETGVMGFEHWPGKTVVHCHILDHEDLGMMNLLEIRNPSGSPVAPLPGVLDQVRVKPEAIAGIKPEWPTTRIPPANGQVTVYVFLPRPAKLQECAHCTAAVNGISTLRSGDPSLPATRIIAITGPNESGIEELALSLQLDHETDRLCIDPGLKAFQALALVDGNPIHDGVLFTFPDSFKDGTLRHESDLMHGVFVVDPTGFIVAAHRGFRAHDDAEQIRSEIRVAKDVGKALQENAARIAAMPTATPAERAFKLQEEQNLERFQLRYKEHTGG